MDKVAVVKKGIYVVRFRSMEKRDGVLASNATFFDNEPMIVKPWTAHVDMCKENIKTLPIWVQLTLDFEYWGFPCLEKIVKPLGRLIKLDQATSRRQYNMLMQ